MKQKTALSQLNLSNTFLIFVITLSFFGIIDVAIAQDVSADKKVIFNATNLTIPRFVSLGKNLTNVRAGPGRQYPIKWVIKKKGLPVEIILEYDHWRKIRDYEGDEGWVYKTLLVPDRTALVMGKDMVPAFDPSPVRKPKKAKVSMMLEPLSLVDVESCEDTMCYIRASDFSGWIERKLLWGVYEHENFY